MQREPGWNTLAVHGGEAETKSDFGIVDPIHYSSTFTFPNTAAIIDMLEGRSQRDEYARYSTPNTRTVERKLAELEGAQDCILTTTGMSAISLLFLAKLRPGDHLIFFDECYHRTRQLCREYLAEFGISYSQVQTNNLGDLEAAIRPETKLLFSELPTNPHLTVIDLEGFISIAAKHGVKTCLDSTLASPVNILPIKWGADFVVHSATKYLGGHNDLLAGTLAGRTEDLADIRKLQGIIGAICAPQTAYLLQRGLKTLALRIEQQNRSAQAIASFLENHPRIKKVYYPGLETHPTHELAKTYLKGFGGLLSFELDADRQQCSDFIDRVRIPKIGPSLGGVESLIEQPAIMSYYNTPIEDRRRFRIDDALVRMAVGIEDTQDLITDLAQALG